MQARENRGLSGNCLKIIAAASMFIDHVGMMFFPTAAWMRALGRLAFPVYAFMIAEGCRYTRNRVQYFLGVFLLAAVCQGAYFIFASDTYMSVLVTFSLAILVIYAMDWFKTRPGVLTGLAFALSVAAVYGLNRVLTIDYGFWGCMVPVFAAALQKTKRDRKEWNIAMWCLGLVLLALDRGGLQWYSLAALPLLLCYSGERGRLRMKYFFYIFYPAHLVVLEGLWLLLYYIV